MTDIITTWSEDRDWEKIDHEVVVITPEIAREMLKRNTRNRTYRPWRTQYFMNLLNTGKFELTGQGLEFYVDGVLADGQHRLWAISKSGVSTPLDIRYGVPLSAAHVMDLPLRRRPGDFLSLLGEQDGNLLGAALRLLYRYLYEGVYVPVRNADNYDLLEALLERHGQHAPGDPPEADIRNYISVAKTTYTRTGIVPSAALVASYLTGEPPNPDDGDWFAGLLGTGQRYGYDPRSALERMVNKERAQGNKSSRLNTLWLVAIYGSAYRNYASEQRKPVSERTGAQYFKWRQGDDLPVFGRVKALRELEKRLANAGAVELGEKEAEVD